MYYGWLADASEKGERQTLESCEAVRETLGVGTAATAELYASTEIDELVLTACCEQMLDVERPLPQAEAQWLLYLEGQLAARPGTASSVMASLGADDA